MLPKKNKLPIQNISQKPQRVSRTFNLTLKIFPTPASSPRFGVVISKKTAKTAVKRNKLKRAIFHAAESFLSNLPTADYLIIINHDLDKTQIQEEINKIFSQFKK